MSSLQAYPWIVASAVALGLLLIVRGAGGLQRRGWPAKATRRLVHVSVGLFVAAAPYLFAGPTPLYVLAGGFALLNGVALRREKLPGLHAGQPSSWGTVTFPLAVFPVAFMYWTLKPEHNFAFQIAFLVLACSDPIAAWVGERDGKDDSGKTLPGTIGFAISAFVLAGMVLAVFQHTDVLGWSSGEVALAAVIAATVGAAIERLGRQGWDNFFVAIGVAVALAHFDAYPSGRLQMGGSIVAGAVFGVAAWKLRFLTARGAWAGGLLAASVIGLGGWAWAGPSLCFFLLSSLLSKLGKRRKRGAAVLTEKGDQRDARQVYANGGVAWAFLVMYAVWPAEGLFWGFLGAFAAAMADTWATELGILSAKRPRLITTGRPVAAGTSGGVSTVGSAGAAAGALVLAASLILFAPNRFSWTLLLAVTGAGLLGTLADSLAGATLQAQYSAPKIDGYTERPGPSGAPHTLARGLRFVNNDRVNLLGTSVGALSATIAYYGLTG